MDASVAAALQRWPNVPAVYGWLSLDARGVWRLHPEGDALDGTAGEPITNPQIVAFIGRNYESDEAGRWYFQNGPQRVFVRLDAAPYVLRLDGSGTGFETHTGMPVRKVHAWLLDDQDRLFARTPAGGAIVSDRDLAAVLAMLRPADGGELLGWLENARADARTEVSGAGLAPAPLLRIEAARVPGDLGFIPCPKPGQTS